MNSHSLPLYWLIGTLLLVLGCSEKPETFSRKRPSIPAPSQETSHVFNEIAGFLLEKQFSPSINCNIERVNGKPFSKEFNIAAQQSLSLSGWVVDSDGKHLPDAVFIRAEQAGGAGRYYVTAPVSATRPDIVQLFSGNTALLHSGFDTEIRLGALAPGKYRLQIVFLSRGNAFVCDNGRSLIIS